MSLRRASRVLGITEELTRVIARSGALESVRVKGQLFFTAASVQDLDENMVPICVVAPLVQMKSKTITELIDTDKLPPSVVIHGRRKPHRTTLLHKRALVEWRMQSMTRVEIQARFGLPRRRVQRALKASPLAPIRLPYDERHYYPREQVEILFSAQPTPIPVR